MDIWYIRSPSLEQEAKGFTLVLLYLNLVIKLLNNELVICLQFFPYLRHVDTRSNETFTTERDNTLLNILAPLKLVLKHSLNWENISFLRELVLFSDWQCFIYEAETSFKITALISDPQILIPV